MFGLPTSASDAFGPLYALSVQARDGRDVRREISDVVTIGRDDLENKLLAAVKFHLLAATDLANSRNVGPTDWTTISFHWDESLAELRETVAALRPRAHAFHMRLASKYADYYRSFDQRALENWIRASRLKSEFLGLCALYRGGAKQAALDRAATLSQIWRKNLPVRLRGLYDIERTASAWATEIGDTATAASFLERASEGTGRFSPYSDDEPNLWRPPRSIESTVRFAFAAAVIPVALVG